MRKFRVPEYRAEDVNPKLLTEQLAAKKKRMKEILDGAKVETRAMSEDEDKEFTNLEKEANAIKATLAAEERARDLFKDEGSGTPGKSEGNKKNAGAALGAFIRGAEVRAGEMSVSSTGGIIPTEFSSDIIKSVTELSGIFNLVGKVNSKGVYKQIVRKNKITSAGAVELSQATRSATDFETIEIGHHKYMAEAVMSLEVIAQTEFDIVSEVLSQFTEAFTLQAETTIIGGNGTNEATGLVNGGTKYTLAAQNVITADEIVKIYHALKTMYRNNAAWLMSNDTLCAIRLIKDADGQYIFHQADLTSGFAGTILGKPVYTSEAMDNLGAGKHPILFGDYGRAYKANVNPEMSIQVLNELYAPVGIIGILWLDGKPVNNEAYVTVECASEG